MSNRITEKDLAKAASELSELAGEQFKVQYANGRVGLYHYPACRTIYLCETKPELLQLINAFHSGIEFGLRMVKEGKSPDLADPQAALRRMSNEIGAIRFEPSKYPDGLEDKLDKASGAVNEAIDYAKPLDADR